MTACARRDDRTQRWLQRAPPKWIAVPEAPDRRQALPKRCLGPSANATVDEHQMGLRQQITRPDDVRARCEALDY